MNQLIVTVLGNDKRGIVENIAQVVFKHNGNWLASSFAKLSGKFAGLVQIAVADSEAEALTNELVAIPDLQVSISSGQAECQDPQQQVSFTVTANDRKGIIQEISQKLCATSANILELETEQVAAAAWGSELFKARIKVEAPEHMSLDELSDALESIADDLIIDF